MEDDIQSVTIVSSGRYRIGIFDERSKLILADNNSSAAQTNFWVCRIAHLVVFVRQAVRLHRFVQVGDGVASARVVGIPEQVRDAGCRLKHRRGDVRVPGHLLCRRCG